MDVNAPCVCQAETIEVFIQYIDPGMGNTGKMGGIISQIDDHLSDIH